MLSLLILRSVNRQKIIYVVLFNNSAYSILFFIFFHHANIHVKFEKTLSDYIITPNLHRVHHSAQRNEHDSNYGIVLAFWDKLFGTRKEAVPETIGLDIVEADNFVQLFFLAFITERHIKKWLHVIPRGKKNS